jgi:hypothetical protein
MHTCTFHFEALFAMLNRILWHTQILSACIDFDPQTSLLYLLCSHSMLEIYPLGFRSSLELYTTSRGFYKTFFQNWSLLTRIASHGARSVFCGMQFNVLFLFADCSQHSPGLSVQPNLMDFVITAWRLLDREWRPQLQPDSFDIIVGIFLATHSHI